MKTIISAFLAFATTNVDDIFILILFYSNVANKRRDIVFGQYAGIILIILISLIGSLVGLLIEKTYIGILGIIPLTLGIVKLYHLGNRDAQTDIHNTPIKSTQSSLWAVAAVTFANGADNIGVYIPLFSNYTLVNKIITIIIFLICVGLWCFIGWLLVSHKQIAEKIGEYAAIITPIVLVCLGLYIIYESGLLQLLLFK